MIPVAAAMALAQFAPAIIKWVSGSDKAEQAAETIVGIAEQVTGFKGDAAVEAIKADPNLAIQFRMAVMAQEADLDKAFLADRADARARDVAYVQAGRRNARADIMVALAFIAVIAIAALLAMGKIDGNTAAGGFLIAVGGMFARNIGTAFDFEFGSSRGSQTKDAAIADLARRE